MSDLLTGLTSGVHATARVHVATTTWTYDELLGAAAAAGPLLAPYRRVAVHATPSATTVLAVVGAVLAGVEVVPVPPDAGRSELAHLLTDSAAEAWAGPVPDDRVSGLPVVDLDLGAHACHEPRDVAEDATAMVVYTSGTTGLPKGVVLSRRAVAAGLDALAGAWDWDASDTLAHGLPLFHVHGLVLGVLGALRLGCGLLHVGKPTPAAYADAVRSGATVLFGVPTLWSRIAGSPDDAAALRPARLLVSGSAPLPAPVFDRLRELSGHGVVERYGMSETLVTLATRADAEPRAGWVGVPVAGVATRLRDEDGHPVPHDGESVGQLEVRGPSLLEGYLGRPDADAEAWTADGWFRTGDVAVVDPDGWHRIVGRASVDLIKSGGYRIGAGEVETVLLGHAAVAEVAVVGVPDPDLGQRVVAHVVLRDGYAAGDALAAELVAHVGTELNGHKRPREVRFVAGLPRTALGKVQKAALSAG
ncbi:fatty acid CoA ligase FadD36 [Nocardioides zeae]|uniref:Fatty acid CoA ligase FadD36 n=1 Tax=Nocardioides zeae TaxID=1457234 RepID=A0ACC6IDJ4_9ACTN|nr:AMP-binding protein [Nocardioides zeae]MDR6175790.1 fatty acid CoA ligase FadD36 [Nocardioides zeae]MDR6208718.1 fatty acid CoA ligase FadD36 [Nocardioides zeae]